jgi:hypothetical protein
LDTLVNQATQLLIPDGAIGAIKLSRSGALVSLPFINQCIAEGRGFQISNVAKQTALATGGLSYSDTVPAFSLDVPTGLTMVPLKIMLNQGGTVAGGVITVIISHDTACRVASAGTAVVPSNLRSDAPAASNVTAFSTSPTVGAGTAANRGIWAAILKHDVATSPNSAENKVDLDYFKDMLPILVGPASLQIHTFAGTTQPSWFYRIAWVEFPTIFLK